MSKPKLALIPSGYKSGKVYSILPNDASGDFDFERQSIGTRVRKDGLIEEAKTEGSITNDFLHSEDYSQSEWNKSNLTVTTNQELAPDGTNTADEIFETSATSFKNINQQTSVTANKRYTTSFFVKYNNIQYLQITGSSGFPSSIVNFDIQNKTIVHNPSNELARIDELANGWARISLTLLCSTTTNGRMLIVAINSATASRLPSYTGNTSNSFYLWGGMMSEGALSDYIKTEGTTETKTVETFTDVPRLDWLNSNCPSLILEPQRTNLVYPNTNLSGYSINNGVKSDNVITSPDGENNGSLVQSNGGGTSVVYKTFSTSTNTSYNISVFLKKGNYNNIRLQEGFTSSQMVVDLSNGTEVSSENATNKKIEDYSNGWYRVSFNYTSHSSISLAQYSVYINGSTASGNTFYTFGGQIEQGSYLTSYMKTEASAVTRLKDECYGSGDSDLFNITEGTFFVDILPYINTSSNHYISLNDGGSSDRFVFIFQSYGTQVRLFASSGGFNIISHYQNITFYQRNKLAVTFKEDEFKFYVNGSLVDTVTSGSMPTGLNQLDFSEHNGNRNFEGKVHDTKVYDRVLTEAEAIELTTL